MARYKRLPRKKQEKADDFISTVDHIVRFVGHYKVWVMLVIIVFAVLWVGRVVLSQNSEKDIMAINRALYESDGADDKANAYQNILNQFSGYKVVGATHLLLADYYLENNKNADALKEVEQSLSDLPDFLIPLASFEKAKFLWEEGKLQEAYQAVESLTGSYAVFLKAQILDDLGRNEEAMSLYEELSNSVDTPSLLQQGALGALVRLKTKDHQ